jgi:RNA polymerase sigma factor (sigma-70 family)
VTTHGVRSRFARVLGDAADRELLDRWGQGDREAGALLLERHFDALYAFLRHRAIGSVDDLMQQTLLACVESRARFRGEASFRTYLLQIARYQLYAHYRRAKSGRSAEWHDVAEHDPSPTAKLVRKQDERLVLQGLRRLPPIFQAVLKLSFFDGLTGPEIADALCIPEPTVRSRLRRALKRLRHETSELAADADSLRETASELEQWAARLDHTLEMRVSA